MRLLASQWMDLIYRSVDMLSAALHPRPRELQQKQKNILWRTYVFFLVLVFQLEKTGEEHIDYMIMANQLRSFNIHTTPLMIASEVSEKPSSSTASLPPDNIIFRAVFSFRHFLFLPYIPRHTYLIPFPECCCHYTAPYSTPPAAGSIVEESCRPCVCPTKHFLFTDRCPLHLQQPHSISIRFLLITPLVLLLFFLGRLTIALAMTTLANRKRLILFKGCVSWIP